MNRFAVLHVRLVLLSVVFLSILRIARGSDNDSENRQFIRYRQLWDIYRVSQFSGTPDSRLKLTSSVGKDPAKFHFTPLDEAGNSVVVCKSNGLCTVRWNEKFYEENTMIERDPSDGEGILFFQCGFKQDSDVPAIVQLYLHGIDYAYTLYYLARLSSDGVFASMLADMMKD